LTASIPRGLFLPDTSAVARSRNHSVKTQLSLYGRSGLLATCITVDLEVFYSARNPAEYARIASLRSEALTDLPILAAIGERVKIVQAKMSAISQHRSAGVVDLLTAAIAEYYGATILHYDKDFEAIAEITGQGVRWIVPAGSIS